MKILSLIATAVVCAALFSACTTTQQITPATATSAAVTNTIVTMNPVAQAAIVDTIQMVGSPLADFARAKDTNAAPYFAQAAIIIRAAVNSGVYDPAAIKSSLSVISVSTLRGPYAASAEDMLLGLYASAFGKTATSAIDRQTYLPPILTAIANALSP